MEKQTRFKIDWNKVKTLDDLKELLEGFMHINNQSSIVLQGDVESIQDPEALKLVKFLTKVSLHDTKQLRMQKKELMRQVMQIDDLLESSEEVPSSSTIPPNKSIARKLPTKVAQGDEGNV